jgi:DNA-binding NarL/FixJ family response regulator
MPRESKREQVRELMERGLKVREVAQLTGISTQGVHAHLKRLGIKTKGGLMVGKRKGAA